MKRRHLVVIVLLLLSIPLLTTVAGAAPVTQSFDLQPGWNAIFLEVEPASAVPDDVFAAIKSEVESVWQWNSRTGTVEFIQNPNLLVPDEPQMLVYIPDNTVVTNLFAIQGNNAYLVRMNSAQTLIVNGEPAIPRRKWKANSFNFVGFHLAENDAPSFESFFASSFAHVGQEIYTLDNATASWVLTSPTETMRRGEGFWVYCDGSSTFNGPVSATLEQSSGLHFGSVLSEQDLTVHNNGAGTTITLSLPTLNDTVHYWVFDNNDQVARWDPLPASLPLTIAPGDSQKLRVGVKRTGLVVDTPYVANVEVSSDDGVSFLLPLSVTGISYSGLWTGYATIDKVSDQNKVKGDGTQDDTPLPTGSEFDFRLIIHADNSGVVRLLSQVIQMWEGGTLKPDPDNLGGFIVDELGHFVLFSDESLIGNYEGSLLRDGQQIGRRISAPIFPRLSGATELMATAPGSVGTFPEPGYGMRITITLEKDDKTNPFLHLFHKTHGLVDNSIKVTRVITLTLADEDEAGNPITGLPALNWGSSEIGGVYEETISAAPNGLHKLPIKIRGTFVLHRVSNVATLTQAQ